MYAVGSAVRVEKLGSSTFVAGLLGRHYFTPFFFLVLIDAAAHTTTSHDAMMRKQVAVGPCLLLDSLMMI